MRLQPSANPWINQITLLIIAAIFSISLVAAALVWSQGELDSAAAFDSQPTAVTNTDLWVTNGTVETVEVGPDGKLYVGGVDQS